jgi:hypothetical protein
MPHDSRWLFLDAGSAFGAAAITPKSMIRYLAWCMQREACCGRRAAKKTPTEVGEEGGDNPLLRQVSKTSRRKQNQKMLASLIALVMVLA